jgi:hypothetical protein
MEIKIEEYVQELIPWDLSIIVGGESYATRPITIGDIVALEGVRGDASSRDGDRSRTSPGRLMELVRSFFSPVKPNVEDWRVETLRAVIEQVVAYWSDISKKTRRRRGRKRRANNRRRRAVRVYRRALAFVPGFQASV